MVRLVRHVQNRGVVAAVHSGLDHVSGEFLIVCASDDFILPGLFARAEAAFRACPEAALFCTEAVMIDRDDNIVGFRPMTPARQTSGYVSPADARTAARYSDNWFVGTSVIYRRSRMQEIGGFDFSLGSLADTMFNRLLALRFGFFFQAEVLSAWRIYPESFSNRSSLSEHESERLVRIAREWINARFPPDIKIEYADRFEKRLRFNMARLRLVWAKGGIDADAISDILQWNGLDRKITRAIARLPFAGKLMLAWMTIRTGAYTPRALWSAIIRNLSVNALRRIALKKEIARMLHPSIPQT
jgi:glycosyltransferase involved in cell wall biosynthesis